MFPAGNILGKYYAFYGIVLEKGHKKVIIRLKAGLSLVKVGCRIFQMRQPLFCILSHCKALYR